NVNPVLKRKIHIFGLIISSKKGKLTIAYCLPSFIFPEGIKEPSLNIQVILWCLTILTIRF
ncbi:hypothetical protein, partial [Tenacibaculum maritimum]|uniref:hypothetical protein n=1 Tax=Tenacibaculum maritimum TaxID=107401 RepID=UPI003875C37D